MRWRACLHASWLYRDKPLIGIEVFAALMVHRGVVSQGEVRQSTALGASERTISQ
jgi:hypothetical protein